MTESDSIAAALDRIAKAAAIPISAKWLDAEGVGALLGYTAAQVRERISTRPGFPVPLRLGHPRWKASEVMEWAESERERLRFKDHLTLKLGYVYRLENYRVAKILTKELRIQVQTMDMFEVYARAKANLLTALKTGAVLRRARTVERIRVLLPRIVDQMID